MHLTWVIAGREFTSNILSLRLLVGLIVCCALFVSSVYVLAGDYEKRVRAYDSAKTEHKDELEKVEVYSKLRVNVGKAPEPLSAICLGMEKQLWSTVPVSYVDVPTGTSLSGGRNAPQGIFSYQAVTRGWLSGGGNPLLNVFSHVDAVVIVQIVLSLFTILVAYDVVSGERERGTLGLVMSNPVSRFQILIGKYIGGMGSILLPLTIGWIAGIILLLTSPVVELGWSEWSRIGLLFAVSALYLSVFFMLSMLVSTKAARSATALIYLLFLWVVLVLVIPNGFAYVAGQIRPTESKARLDSEISSMMAEYRQKVIDYAKKHESRYYITSGGSEVYSGMYPIAFSVETGSREAMLWYLDGARFYVPLRIEYADRIGELCKQYYRSLKKQTVLAEDLSRLSPAWVYYNAAAALVGTDLGRYEQFIRRARDYRKELMKYMQEQGAFSTIKWFTRADLEKLPSQLETDRIWRQYNMDDLTSRTQSLSEKEEEQLIIGRLAYRKTCLALSEALKSGNWDEAGPLDLSGLPIFAFGKLNAINAIGQILPDLAILILLNALLFWGAAALFLKREVK